MIRQNLNNFLKGLLYFRFGKQRFINDKYNSNTERQALQVKQSSDE